MQGPRYAVGRFLKAARERRGITHRNLAKRAQVSTSVVTRTEGGADCRLSTLSKLMRALQLVPEERAALMDLL